eukprot:gene16575-5070_t
MARLCERLRELGPTGKFSDPELQRQINGYADSFRDDDVASNNLADGQIGVDSVEVIMPPLNLREIGVISFDPGKYKDLELDLDKVFSDTPEFQSNTNGPSNVNSKPNAKKGYRPGALQQQARKAGPEFLKAYEMLVKEVVAPHFLREYFNNKDVA